MNKHKTESGNSHVMIIVILVLAILGWLGYTYIDQYNLQNSLENVSINNSAEAIKEAKHIIEDKYKKHANGEDYYYAQSAPPYRQAGSDYYVVTDKSPRVGIDVGAFYGSFSEEETSAIKSEIQSLLKGNGYAGTSSPWTNQIYSSTSSICMFSEPDRQFQLSCGDIADYTEVINIIEPLIKTPSKYTTDSSPVYGLHKMNDKNEFGYQSAILELIQDSYRYDVKRLYFYKYNDKDWEYFTTSSAYHEYLDTPNCSRFNTVESKSAFYGMKCFDEINKKTSTVE